MGTGKKKIEIKKKEKASQVMVTFSKRRKGLVTKLNQLHSKTDAKAALALFTPSGRPFTYGEPDFKSVVDQFFNSIGQTECRDFNSCSVASTSCCTSVVDCGEFVGSEMVAFEMKKCLEEVKVEEFDNLEELMCLMNKLKGVQKKFVDLQFVPSFYLTDLLTLFVCT